MKNFKLLYHISFIVYRLSSIIYSLCGQARCPVPTDSIINYQPSTKSGINRTATIYNLQFTIHNPQSTVGSWQFALTQLMHPKISALHFLFTFFPVRLFALTLLLTPYPLLLFCASAHSSPNGGFSPIFSPKENKIAFVSGTYHTPTNLWISDVYSRSQKQLTKYGAINPAFSSDGEKIFFISRRYGRIDFFYFDLKKKIEKKLDFDLPYDAQSPVISSDGEKVAYLTINGTSRNLWIITSNGNDKKQITDNFWVRSFKFTPDNKKIVFLVGRTVGVGIWVKDIKSERLFSIYGGAHKEGKENEIVKSGFTEEPHISPDGKLIAFSTPILGDNNNTIKIAEIGKEKIKELPVKNCASAILAFSPDSKLIAYVHNEHHKYTIHTIKIDGTKDTQITPYHIQPRNPLFSYDGKYIVFEAKEDKKSYLPELWVTDVQGKNIRKVTKSYPSYFKVQPYPKKKKVIYISDKNKIPQIFTYNLETKKEKIIENINLENFIDYNFSPDKKYLLIVYKNEIRIADLNNNKTSNLIRAQNIISAFFSDNKIIFNALDDKMTPQIFQVDLKGKNLKKLSSNDKNESSLSPVLYKNNLYYIREENILQKYENSNSENILLNFSNQKKNPDEKIILSNLRISEDGNFLLFKAGRLNKKNLSSEIWFLNIKSENLELLYQEKINTEFRLFYNIFSAAPNFLPFKKEVIFTCDTNGVPKIYVIDLDTKKLTKLINKYSVLPYPSSDGETIYYTDITNNVENIYSIYRKNGKKIKIN